MERIPQDELCALSGMLILFTQAADILNRKVDMELHKYHRYTKQDVKKATADAMQLSQKLARKLEPFATLGISLGEVDGVVGAEPYKIYDAMIADAGGLLHLALEYTNARKHDELALLKLTSYAKTLATGAQVFSSETIADLMPKV